MRLLRTSTRPNGTTTDGERMNDINAIICQYSQLAGADVVPLGSAGGYSGARFWKVTTSTHHLDQQIYCLRRWPSEHPNADHLQWIHSVLRHVHETEFVPIPCPVPNDQGKTICSAGGCLWEVTPWMPGKADFSNTVDPTDRQTRLINAMETLANWHNGAAAFLRMSEPPHKLASCQTAPGIEMRRRRYRDLRTCGARVLRQCVAENRASQSSDVVDIANQLILTFEQSRELSDLLTSASDIKVDLQPCIRDIWHDHVFFTGNQVTGIIDFGAMRMESVAGDVARLLGSLTGGVPSEWEIGLAAYRERTGLSEANVRLAETWDQANAAMAGLQWVEWLFVEQRQFDDMTAVHRRMVEHLDRMRHDLL